MANRENLPEIDTYITTDQVRQGFWRWRENTSTSPSGCHLGLQRIATYPAESNELEEIWQNILQIQTDVTNIPIQQGFSPRRWQTDINAMLEKIPGKPLLHKLRVIHILEADYNLALKQIFRQENFTKLWKIQSPRQSTRWLPKTTIHHSNFAPQWNNQRLQ
jgi:hypothetical protein